MGDADLKAIFWMGIALVLYAYVGYPLVVGTVARLRGRPVRSVGRFYGSISIVLAAYNEECRIARRLDELDIVLTASGYDGEIIVVSDGSTDGTAGLAKGHTGGRVRVVELPVNGGKAQALTVACAAAVGEIVVFADARQRWASDALENLLRNFTVPEIGAVGGDLIVETGSGLMRGVGLYWRYEKWLRRAESLVHSTVGVTGAISAVRRALFRPIPKGTVLDDLYWPLQVAMQGHRVIHEAKACAFDDLPVRSCDEFRRKVRTLAGNFQVMTRLPKALLPGYNPIWLAFWSHKVLRLAVPWALLGTLIASARLPDPLYHAAFTVQLAFYILGLVGVLLDSHGQSRLTSAAGSFLVLNLAAWLAFWVWVSGKSESSWHKARYRQGTDA